MQEFKTGNDPKRRNNFLEPRRKIRSSAKKSKSRSRSKSRRNKNSIAKEELRILKNQLEDTPNYIQEDNTIDDDYLRKKSQENKRLREEILKMQNDIQNVNTSDQPTIESTDFILNKLFSENGGLVYLPKNMSELFLFISVFLINFWFPGFGTMFYALFSNLSMTYLFSGILQLIFSNFCNRLLPEDYAFILSGACTFCSTIVLLLFQRIIVSVFNKIFEKLFKYSS
jgi:flagellar biosynthesis GTPase FlhF